MRRILPLFFLTTAAFAQDYGVNHRMKIEISGQTRKGVLFLPKALKKNQVLPLLVTIPANDGKAFNEVGAWQKDAFDNDFALFSVDVTTSNQKGWHPSETADMQRDMEAVVEGLKQAQKVAKENGAEIDESAIVITGHSGGSYLALWLAVRRPDLFLAVCGRGIVFFPETIDGYKREEVPHDTSLRVFLYYGEFDARRAKDGSRLAAKMLKDKGYKNVRLQVVEKMKHESKPEVCVDWYARLLKSTAKGRTDAVKIRREVEKLKADLAKGRAIWGKLAKLAAKEKKSGFGQVAQSMLRSAESEAQKEMAKAKSLKDDNKLDEALEVLKGVEKKYSGLAAMKAARAQRSAILKSDEYKAFELLQKAKKLIDKGRAEKAKPTLEKLIAKYPKSVAAEEAKGLLEG